MKALFTLALLVWVVPAEATVAWYLCPYDQTLRSGYVVRKPAVTRYIGPVPNADHATFSATEILGNHVLAIVDAPDTVHAKMAADTDFTVLPLPDAKADVSKSGVQAKLQSLGYTAQEIAAAGTDLKALYNLLTSVVSPLTLNAAKDGLVVSAGRQAASKSVDTMTAEVGRSQK
jgi:hypothetical protein